MSEPPPADDLVALLRTTDVAFLPLVKSVLDAAGVPYVVQGEEALALFPLGAMGGGHGLGAAVLVPRSRLEEAKALLESAREGEP